MYQKMEYPDFPFYWGGMLNLARQDYTLPSPRLLAS